MGADLVLTMNGPSKQSVWDHLKAAARGPEQAGFVFARTNPQVPRSLEFLDWWPVAAPDFEHQSRHYLELVDSMRGRLIKHAHDLGAALVEFHSHPGARIAEFSPSDIHGFRDWVRIVRWRLGGRPYGAVVVGASSFDSLVWCEEGERPSGVLLLNVDGAPNRPTGHTMVGWDENHGRYEV